MPYVSHLFNACMLLGYDPRMFRSAITVMLKKADKETYETPKSWRPVALLCCLAKMLEMIFAN